MFSQAETAASVHRIVIQPLSIPSSVAEASRDGGMRWRSATDKLPGCFQRASDAHRMERHVAVPGGSKNSTAVSNSRNAAVVGRFVATGCSGVTNAQMTSKLPA